MATETLLMHAVSAGGDRQELHERIRQHAHAAAAMMKQGEESDLVERIAGDSAFGMDQEAIEALMDGSRFVGRAPQQVDRFLREWVDPVLEVHLESALALLHDAQVRV